MTLHLVESENVGGLHAAIADRLAAEDDARREWLNAMVKGGSRCRFCGTTVSDRTMQRTPGVCAHRDCRRKGAREAMALTQINQQVPAPPAEGAEMPKGYRRGQACKTCESRGTRHKAGCAEDTEAVPAKAEKKAAPEGRLEDLRKSASRATTKTPRSAAPLGLGSADLAVASVQELVDLIEACRAELRKRKAAAQAQLRDIEKVIEDALGEAA